MVETAVHIPSDNFRKPDKYVNIGLRDWCHDLNKKLVIGMHELEDFKRATVSTRINISPEYSVMLPSDLSALADQIRTSRRILSLKDDWDGEGSMGYDERTLVQAVKFLISYAKRILEDKGIVIDTPRVTPAHNGSIDLLWEGHEYNLLINVPAYPDVLASFYGDHKNGDYIKGKFNIKTYNQGIILFLIGSTGHIDL